jgi:hypothetical protein
MENDTAAELARLDLIERHLRRCGAFDETTQSELALARVMAGTRGMERSSPCEPLERPRHTPDMLVAEGSAATATVRRPQQHHIDAGTHGGVFMQLTRLDAAVRVA